MSAGEPAGAPLIGRRTLADAAALLGASGIDAPLREARTLLLHALGLPPGTLPPSGEPPDSFWPLVARRAAREPMALITGHQGFWTLDLAVSRDTLIPRADTETLIEAALAIRPDRARVRRVLDLGTGTGALLLAALTEYPGAVGIGVDCVPAACALARSNAEANGLALRAWLVCGIWGGSLVGGFDLVLGNPPYIRRDAMAGLMPEVAAFEPPTALDGGPDGLDAYRAILGDLPRLLAPDGVAILELGQGQEAGVGDLARRHGLAVLGARPDLGGIDRALVLALPR